MKVNIKNSRFHTIILMDGNKYIGRINVVNFEHTEDIMIDVLTNYKQEINCRKQGEFSIKITTKKKIKKIIDKNLSEVGYI